MTVKRLVLFWLTIRPAIYAFGTNEIFGLRINEIVGLGLIAVLFYYYFIHYKEGFREPYNGKFVRLIIYVIIASIFGIFITPWVTPFIYVKQFLRFLTGYAIFVTFPLLFTTRKDLKNLLLALLFSTFINTFFAMGQILIGPGFLGLGFYQIGEGVSLTGTYEHYGQYAMIAVMGPLLIMALIGILHKKYKTWLLLLFITYFAVGMGTLSRSVLICLVIETGALMILLSSKNNFPYIFLFSAAAFIFINTDYFDNQMSGFETRSEYEFQVLEGERDIKFLGHGRAGRIIDYYESFSKYPLPQKIIGAGINPGPHGDWYYWLFMYGFIGLIMYLFFYFGLTGKIYRIYKKTKQIKELRSLGIASLAGMTIFLVIGAFVTNSSMMIDYQIVIMSLVSMYIYSYKKYKYYLRKKMNTVSE
jgi:ABC-type multidrug transport system fused ATPase/permease subunit